MAQLTCQCSALALLACGRVFEPRSVRHRCRRHYHGCAITVRCRTSRVPVVCEAEVRQPESVRGSPRFLAGLGRSERPRAVSSITLSSHSRHESAYAIMSLYKPWCTSLIKSICPKHAIETRQQRHCLGLQARYRRPGLGDAQSGHPPFGFFSNSCRRVCLPITFRMLYLWPATNGPGHGNLN